MVQVDYVGLAGSLKCVIVERRKTEEQNAIDAMINGDDVMLGKSFKLVSSCNQAFDPSQEKTKTWGPLYAARRAVQGPGSDPQAQPDGKLKPLASRHRLGLSVVLART